jgi:hypothetical protein
MKQQESPHQMQAFNLGLPKTVRNYPISDIVTALENGVRYSVSSQSTLSPWGTASYLMVSKFHLSC